MISIGPSIGSFWALRSKSPPLGQPLIPSRKWTSLRTPLGESVADWYWKPTNQTWCTELWRNALNIATMSYIYICLCRSVLGEHVIQCHRSARKGTGSGKSENILSNLCIDARWILMVIHTSQGQTLNCVQSSLIISKLFVFLRWNIRGITTKEDNLCVSLGLGFASILELPASDAFHELYMGNRKSSILLEHFSRIFHYKQSIFVASPTT